ncbi:hypothetical protein [Agathobacter sp.]|uniref:hypothetical protein n=1 Tax=Agathobacter sp. TaxID=2021311 RepID=UPI002A91BBFF|nr:hypothetical protein [Agathobacter sp.]
MDARLKLIAGNGGTFPDLLEQKTQTQIHSAIQQMKVQIKGLPRSKSHHRQNRCTATGGYEFIIVL